MTKSIKDTINQAPMSRFQITAVTICILINILDGYDVLVIAFAAPAIAEDWGLSMQSLGIVFSAGLVGMVIGSLFIAPFADRIGRRRILLFTLVIITIGMCLSAAAQSIGQLIALRIFTGIGIGSCLASLNTIVSEYSSLKRKNFTISLLAAGYPVGATSGGIIAAVLIVDYGWQSLFLYGGILSGLLIPLVYLKLPESFHYLLAARPDNALEQVNALLKKMGHAPIKKLPEQKDKMNGKAGVKQLFSPQLVKSTLLLWLAYFMLMLSFYFVISWTPKIIVDAGLSLQAGISGSVLMNTSGIVGGLFLGYCSHYFGLRRLVQFFMLLSALMMVVFASIPTKLFLTLIIAFMIGFFIFGSMTGLYAMVCDIYRTEIRNTGMGWAIGIGRFGAVAGPAIAGVLLQMGWSGSQCFYFFAAPMLMAMLSVFWIKRLQKNVHEES